MLRTRLWMGAILIGVGLAALLLDWPPWYPILLVLVLLVGLLASWELHSLLPTDTAPPLALVLGGTFLLLLAPWLNLARVRAGWPYNPWDCVALSLTVVLLAAFLVEMARFREPGHSINRVAMAVWSAAYLGVLPTFLTLLRWLRSLDGEGDRGAVAVAFAIFVPKACDIGAYFTGRFLGRHKMAPVLSPKKTWEGAAGGLIAAAALALLIQAIHPVSRHGFAMVGLIGLLLGIAGMLGDLAESLIKRDFGRKDASQAMPGFGGVLDVIDSILFAAPVAYAFLTY